MDQLLTAYHHLRRVYWRAVEPTLVGVRGLIVRDGQVLLVRHTYLAGWYLPGGKVDRGETVRAAMCREVEEECGLRVKSARLVGVYANSELNRNDHIALFVVDDFEEGLVSRLQRLEIAETGFFPVHALPAGTTPATHRRLLEYRRQRFEDEHW